MSHTIWVDVQGREPNNDSTMMLRMSDELDRLASNLNVARLSDFHDYSSLAADFAEEVEADSTAAKWFDPAAALAAVRAIHEHLLRHPEDLGFTPTKGQQHWPGALMRELQECRSILQEAASQGRKFRMLIVA